MYIYICICICICIHICMYFQRKTNLSTVERLSAKEEESGGLEDMLAAARLDIDQLQTRNSTLVTSVQDAEHTRAEQVCVYVYTCA